MIIINVINSIWCSLSVRRANTLWHECKCRDLWLQTKITHIGAAAAQILQRFPSFVSTAENYTTRNRD